MPKQLVPEKLEHFRKISGLKSFAKIADKLIAEMVANGMAAQRDKAQYGNQEKLSI